MILATVGTQLPFPRLTEAVALWARAQGEPATIQAGQAETDGAGAGDGAGDGPVKLRNAIPPVELDAIFARARVVVGHAGIGTILSAQRHRRPLIILPRRAALGEHRNDHQLATAGWVEGRPGIYVAWEATDIAPLLGQDLEPASPQPSPSSDGLIRRLSDFLAPPDRGEP